MLICPQCQFENSDENRFCQECGMTLTQKVCPKCGSKVNFDTQDCPTCGTVTGTVWRAVISGAKQLDQIQGVSAASDSASTALYLDLQQRYKLLDPLPDQTEGTDAVQVRVLDCQPFQLSPLEALLNQGTRGMQLLEIGATDPATPEAIGSSPNSADLTIPPSAQPYLALQAQFHQAIPKLHDAWQHKGQEVLLLEDHTASIPLLDLWSDENISALQILHWLYEMSDLWAALEPWKCRQSLLELSNLQVDEDQIFCVQRLYVEQTPLSLQDLGKLWQDLFSRTQRTQLGAMALLMHNLQIGEIQTVEQLQAQLNTIANSIQGYDSEFSQVPLTESPMTSELPAPGMPDSSRESSPDEITAVPESSSFAAAHPSFEADDDLDPTALLHDDAEDSISDADDTPTVVLPMRLFSLEDAGRTDTGRQRDHNEDFFGIHTVLYRTDTPQSRTLRAQGLYILCDGMGGHAGGEVASALAVNTLKQYFQEKWFQPSLTTEGLPQLPTEESIREAVYLANKAIYDINQNDARSGSGRMGTTLILVLIQGTQVAVASVGDSRLYYLSRRRGLEQVTTDHDVGQREIQRGVEPTIAYARPDAYQLTQALGPRNEDFIHPDVHFLDLNEDTLLLLCSDGLTDNDLVEMHWRTHLEPLLSSQANLDQGVSRLIDLANQYNGHDNITALVIRMKVRPNLEHLNLR